MIRKNIDTSKAPRGEVVFRPDDALEDPEKDLRASIEEAQRRRKEAKRGWRKDNSWGPLDEGPEE
jgi:hypothetical protein